MAFAKLSNPFLIQVANSGAIRLISVLLDE
jgi:hypothetical protein